jgi:hypothetical protein
VRRLTPPLSLPHSLSQVTEDDLIRLLDQVAAVAGGGRTTKITIQRRSAFDDDD